jgi:hypothetical protein
MVLGGSESARPGAMMHPSFEGLDGAGWVLGELVSPECPCLEHFSPLLPQKCPCRTVFRQKSRECPLPCGWIGGFRSIV